VSDAFPPAQGLYDRAFEHDACGVAFVATLTGEPSHEIVAQGLTALRNLEHRGAVGSEPNSGDGAGILVQVPDAFLREVVPFDLPAAGHYAVGLAFIPEGAVEETTVLVERIAAEESLRVLGWRDVPVTPSLLGSVSRSTMPHFRHLFLAVYFPSLSSRTLVYKGMLTTGQLEPFFPDLSDRRMTSALALVHSRFSTNTFPSWPLAHPYR
jgi:glutamate synthase (NADPH) large chain